MVCVLAAAAPTLKFRVNWALPLVASAGDAVLVQVKLAETAWQAHPDPGGAIDCGTMAVALLNVKVTVTALLVFPAPLALLPSLTVMVAVLPVAPCSKVPAGLPLSAMPTLRTGG